MRLAVIVVAGGSGQRFGRADGKQLLPVAGLPALSWSLSAVASARPGLIVIVCPDKQRERYDRQAVSPLGLAVPYLFASGGATRQQSVASGLAAVPAEFDLIAVHDGARPALDETLLTELVRTLERSGADGVVPGYPAIDTMKVVDGDRVGETPERGRLWAVQTPQVFRAGAIREAYARAARDGFEGTDDASLVEYSGGDVRVARGPRDNLKLTVPEDEVLVAAALRSHGRGEVMTRIGIGYDVHAFAENRRLVLGGVEIPHDRGLAGHSDADVLAHALADAVLGALRAGDIGKLFPDTDPAYAGADSIVLLERVRELADSLGWRVADADCVLILESPKIAPYREHMRENLAGALRVPVSAVGVKATTTEGLGFEGRGEGVAAQAVVILERC